MLLPTAEPGDWRYERKFQVFELGTRDIEALFRMHHARFRVAYPTRHINNCYFDLPGLPAFADSVEGATDRLKVRIRWYGPLLGAAVDAALELKIKRGLMGRKEHFAVTDLHIDATCDAARFRAALRSADLQSRRRRQLRGVQPTLVNRYLRRYLVSADGRFRVTIDSAAVYYEVKARPPMFRHKIVDHFNSIVELKYAAEHSEDADAITNDLPFRLTRWSKYVNGIESLLPG